jgi:hypothetical protein
METFIKKKVIIRCDRAGVFYGTLSEFDAENKIAKISSCRRIWYWDGAASLSQLAKEGVTNKKSSKFTVVVDEILVCGVIEIIPCTEEAIINIESVPAWRK